MGAGTAITGYALIACGPLAAVALQLLQRPLLLLLAFASAFYWLLCIVGICTLARGLVPIASSSIKLVLVSAGAAALQEYARWVLCRVHSVMVQVIHRMTASPTSHTNAALSHADMLSMYATHGVAHAAVVVMCLFASWLPLLSDGGTYYHPSCTCMSWFGLAALLSLGYAAFLVGAAVVSMDAIQQNVPNRAHVVTGIHVALACLVSSAAPHCITTIVATMCCGVATAAWALHTAWTGMQQEARAQQVARLIQHPAG